MTPCFAPCSNVPARPGAGALPIPGACGSVPLATLRVIWRRMVRSKVRVDAGGETSTGLEIHVTVGDLPQNFAGLGNYNTIHSPDDSWEPHFGSIAIDSKHIQDASEPDLFATIAHEIGHVLGSWMGGPVGQHYVSYTDTATGTWTGPNVAAVHGGPAPFQDASDPYAWVEGERDPSASQFDLGHSGVCASLLSYCRYNAPLPAFLPHAIDFAFLADLGLTVTAETDRPETYGLAGWGDYAAFTLSLSRDLQIALADPQPQDDSGVNGRRMLDMVDLLRVEVDAFGYRSAGGLSPSLAARGPSGTARYAGGLIGAALDRRGLPPVTGDAGLALDLGTLDGTASFTSLLVYPRWTPRDLRRRRSTLSLRAVGQRPYRYRDRFHPAGGLLRPWARRGGWCPPRPASRSAGQLRRHDRRAAEAARS